MCSAVWNEATRNPHLFTQQAVEHKDEDTLKRVEQREDVCHEHSFASNVEQSEDPGQSEEDYEDK